MQGNHYMQYGMYQAPQPAMKTYSTQITPETRDMSLLLENLFKPELREKAISELSKQRESYSYLGPALWYSVGTMSILLQEIISIYPLLDTPHLLVKAAVSRVIGTLTLLQTVAFHDLTRRAFLNAQICLFLYPFLRVMHDRVEPLRLTSLGVIGAFVKTDDKDVMQYLLGTEIFPLCLKIMENGTEFSKTLATFIVLKLLLSDLGLRYVCQTPDRFTAVSNVLRGIVGSKGCSARLLRHVIRCYLRLSENPHACVALRHCLPEELRNNTYKEALEGNPNIKKWLLQLLVNTGDQGAKKIFESNANA